jgi:hypothetical protein
MSIAGGQVVDNLPLGFQKAPRPDRELDGKYGSVVIGNLDVILHEVHGFSQLPHEPSAWPAGMNSTKLMLQPNIG